MGLQIILIFAGDSWKGHVKQLWMRVVWRKLSRRFAEKPNVY